MCANSFGVWTKFSVSILFCSVLFDLRKFNLIYFFIFGIRMCHFSILQILFYAVIRYNNTHEWIFFTSLKRNCAYKSTLHIHTHMVAYRTLTQISLWLFCVFLLNESDRYYSSSRKCACVCMTYTVRCSYWFGGVCVGSWQKTKINVRKKKIQFGIQFHFNIPLFLQ